MNQGANSFQGWAQKSEQSFDQSQSLTKDNGNYANASNNKKNQQTEAPKQQQSIVQSDQKLKTGQAKTSQQIDSIKQQMNKANKSKETAKTQTQTETEKQDKSKSM
ncbi:hypothetical protein [Undibacterium sp. TC9W]|uniref:hypothetical protein n=1 Tax=Undibacterium sp. TC9W TaxID=3413053 RepID=UPI003BF522C0